MTIKISRNAAGNCLNFVGSSLPAYFNACLSGAVDTDVADTVNVVNDIQTANNPNAQIAYEFFQIPFTEFADKDGNTFATAQEAADYITSQGNVIGSSGIGADLTGVAVSFRLDATSTSIIMDNGASYGVNTIKAVPNEDGTIHIHAIGAGDPNGVEDANENKYFEKLNHTLVSVNGTPVAGGLNDVANVLNELFTVGAFESVVISDPYSTMVADVAGVDAGYTLEGVDAIDPIGDDIFTYDGSGYANYAGLKSVATIDQAGEYYTFDIRGEGTIGFGLVHSDASFAAGKYSGNANYANPDNFAAVNSAHYGVQFSHWFHATPNGSWTNYGANTGYSSGPGWSNNWDQQADWLAGNPVKIKCGIDENGFISISSLQNDGSWIMHARSSYPVAQGSEFHLGIKSQSTSARVRTAPKVHLLEPAAPTMHFRWIESPDSTFVYPLFSTAEEAEYYDEIHNALSAGTGSSHIHVYVDDPSNTNWYMPEASHDPASYHYGSAPSGSETFAGTQINWTPITSLTNNDLVPPVFSGYDYTFSENTSVNIQLSPQDVSYTTSVSGEPSSLALSGFGVLQGTLPYVSEDTTYTITVTRTNSYGSSQGVFDLEVLDNLSLSNIPGWTHLQGNTVTPDMVLPSENAVLEYDTTISPGQEVFWSHENYSTLGFLSTVGESVKTTNNIAAEANAWDLQFTPWSVGALNHLSYYGVGFNDNSRQDAPGGTWVGGTWKMVYETSGEVVVYFNDVEYLRSVATYSGPQTLVYATHDSYSVQAIIPSMTVADTAFVGNPPTGFTQESGSMLDSNTLDSDSVVNLATVLPEGKRLLVNKSWIESNVLPYCTNSLEKAYLGVPFSSANWNNGVDLHLDFDAVMRWEGQSSAAHKTTLADGSDAVARHESNIGSATNAYYHYAIEWDGTNLVVLRDTDINKFSSESDYTQFATYSAYESYPASGDLPLVMATKSGGTMTLSMNGISLVDIPAAPVANQTSWTKALDFSGSSERAQMVYSSGTFVPMMMDGLNVTVAAPISAGDTSNAAHARPWATACVFSADGNNSNQHIWNLGDGAGSNDDNIYLRLSSSRQLFFGWGRDGSLNELYIGTITANRYYGIYIGHNGTRLSGADATSINLSECFDVRLMSAGDDFASISDQGTAAEWGNTGYSTVGGRMDRQVAGSLTIGGRGSNRNFHGKVASFITTTLRRNVAMPSDAEITDMITDPVKWLMDYKVGNPYRVSHDNYNNASFAFNDPGSNATTQVWLMGDGSQDSYSNMIRNIVSPTDQNYTKLNLLSMVSNDIQTVTIPGLTS